MKWSEAVTKIKPYIVRIDTPSVHGTGFLVHNSADQSVVQIATAHHVIEHAHDWREPISIKHFASGKEVFLSASKRKTIINSEHDLAYIQFSSSDLPLPSAVVTYIEKGKRLLEGTEVGWCGYPGIAPMSLCFFAGHISAWLQNEDAYLVDGVAIHGVSGCPAFCVGPDVDSFQVIGIVTEYRPNLATGAPLPGVSLIRTIEPFTVLFAEMDKKVENVPASQIPPDNRSTASLLP